MSVPAYEELKKLHKKMYNLEHLLALADWDLQVCMPVNGAKARSDANAELLGLIHGLRTAESTKKLLQEAEQHSDELSTVDQANLVEMRRIYEDTIALPETFVRRRAELTTQTQRIWVKCRADNDVQSWIPWLQQLVELGREEGRIRAGDSGVAPYDAILASREPGMTVAKLDAIYNDIKSWLPQLYREVLERRKGVAESIVPMETPILEEKQVALGRRLMTLFNFDWDCGRYDKAPHPFGGMVKEDVRMTYYYEEASYTKCMFATIHETGHAKYEQNCGPREMMGQPVCMARSGGIHETQSLFLERMIGKSAAFAEVVTPLLKEYLGDQPALTVENVLKINQLVKPSYIRTLADELGNPLHVILRYEIERDLMNGVLEAADVPRVWNEKMTEYMGLSTEGKDNIGCLQDIHWASGGFGSFPAYSIGAIGAAQIMASVRQELGNDVVNECIRTGNMVPIQEKQKEKIWSKGCLYTTDELLTKATGEPLNPKYLREHLERRYLRDEE